MKLLISSSHLFMCLPCFLCAFIGGINPGFYFAASFVHLFEFASAVAFAEFRPACGTACFPQLPIFTKSIEFSSSQPWFWSSSLSAIDGGLLKCLCLHICCFLSLPLRPERSPLRLFLLLRVYPCVFYLFSSIACVIAHVPAATRTV